MKTFLVVFAITTCSLSAADVPLPTFGGKIGDVPQLSLSELLKGGASLPLEIGIQPAAPTLRTPPQSGKKYTSRMPVTAPRTFPESKMPAIIPNSSTDFKLIVREPAVESVK